MDRQSWVVLLLVVAVLAFGAGYSVGEGRAARRADEAVDEETDICAAQMNTAREACDYEIAACKTGLRECHEACDAR